MGAENSDYQKYLYSEKDIEIGSMRQLLRGEASAVEAYKQITDKFKSEPELSKLNFIIKDHQSAVDYWSDQIQDENVKPNDTSGIWGTFVESIVGASKLIGHTTALQTLKEGEEHGLKEYQEFLEAKDAMKKHKKYVREVLIPNQKNHIKIIESLIRL